MKVFVGSSAEARRKMNEVCSWLEPQHQVLRWTSREAFPPESNVFDQLVLISETVDAAIFIFTGDDKSWVRKTKHRAPRDNVWLEYGLFVGALGSDNVRRLIVGQPKRATDLLGVMELRVPERRRTKRDRESYYAARNELVQWANKLSPNARGLGFDLAKFVANNERVSVRDILLSKGPTFLRQKSPREIKALCSDKGKNGAAYYGGQFTWTKEQRKRKLRRIFVRSRKWRYCHGFGKQEVHGIISHLDEDSEQISAKWIYDDNPVLRGTYPDNFGFALFDRSWFVHWSMKAGTFHDHRLKKDDEGVGAALHNRWRLLWKRGEEFDRNLEAHLRSRA